MSKENKPHILIIRFSAMGDVAMAAPVVYAFAKAYPEIKISFVTKPFFRAIVEAIPGVTYIAAETNGKHKGIPGIWKLAGAIKKENVTTIADMHNVLRSKMLCKFVGMRAVKLDKGRSDKKALTRSNNKVFKPLKTTVTRYIDVFQKLGYSRVVPHALPKPERLEKVAHYLGETAKNLVGIAPFAAHQGKEYPQDLMQEVVALLDKQGVSCYLFGAPNERERLKKLTVQTQHCKVVAGGLSYDEEINAIAQLDVMLSMDSGNGHLAAMYGVPTVTLWGVTHPYAGFAPLGQEAHCLTSDRTKYPSIPTSVFGNKVPEGYEDVMRTIAPQTVVAKVLSLL